MRSDRTRTGTSRLRAALLAALVGAPMTAAPARPVHGQVCPHSAGQMHHQAAAGPQLLEPGQAIFGALREVLGRLEADPATDWSRVDLDALREHLVQMDLLFREARVEREPLADGMRFVVRGRDEVLSAARAMGAMHARAVRSEQPSWQIAVQPGEDRVVLEVRSEEAAEQTKIRALGFAGLFTQGSHHAEHHWMLATGGAHSSHH